MSGEKTEKATTKRLKDLRRKGTVARSVELPQAVVLAAAVAMLPGGVRRLADSVQTAMVGALSAPVMDVEVARHTAYEMATGAARALAPLLGAVLLVSLLSSAALTRSMPNPHVLRPRAERLSPKSGVKRLVSAQVPFELSRSVVKLALLAAVTLGVVRAGYGALLAGPGTVDALLVTLRHSLGQLLLRTALLSMVVGLADAAWSRRRFDKQARMSKQDVKDEAKSSEGNPQAKGAIRARARKLSRMRMLSAVATADVVLANPTHLVVALRYEERDGAPVIVAKGAGGAADRIKALAAEHGVPVVADKPLARALYRAAEVGDHVPVELYRAVAEVLAAVYRARRTTSRRTA